MAFNIKIIKLEQKYRVLKEWTACIVFDNKFYTLFTATLDRDLTIEFQSLRHLIHAITGSDKAYMTKWIENYNHEDFKIIHRDYHIHDKIYDNETFIERILPESAEPNLKTIFQNILDNLSKKIRTDLNVDINFIPTPVQDYIASEEALADNDLFPDLQKKEFESMYTFSPYLVGVDIDTHFPKLDNPAINVDKLKELNFSTTDMEVCYLEGAEKTLKTLNNFKRVIALKEISESPEALFEEKFQKLRDIFYEAELASCLNIPLLGAITTCLEVSKAENGNLKFQREITNLGHEEFMIAEKLILFSKNKKHTELLEDLKNLNRALFGDKACVIVDYDNIEKLPLFSEDDREEVFLKVESLLS